MIYPKTDMWIFFTNTSLLEFQVWYLVLFCHLTALDGLELFLLVILRKNILLRLMFRKASLLVKYFFYYTSMTLLLMFPLIWPSIVRAEGSNPLLEVVVIPSKTFKLAEKAALTQPTFMKSKLLNRDSDQRKKETN